MYISLTTGYPFQTKNHLLLIPNINPIKVLEVLGAHQSHCGELYPSLCGDTISF